MDIVEFNWPGVESEWYALTMKVKNNWQLEGNPAIEVKASPSAWVLFGKVHETYDRIAVNLQPGYPITPQSIIKFNFQTWDEKRGLVQEYCRFY